MVANRRFGPLIAIVGLGIFVLIARMYQVQVVEHEVWAAEAINLVRESTTLPYLRGPITDRNGEVFVKDIDACAIQFVYRDFRRNHPLGQVAHARSALEHRPVALDEAARNLGKWALQLVESRPAQLEAFEEGEALVLCDHQLAFVGRGEDRRRSRAADLRFYIYGLLDIEDTQWRAIKKRIKKQAARERTWLELAAETQDKDPALKRAELERRFDTSLGRLEQLASELGVSGPDGELAASTAQSLWFLVEALEQKRRDVEDAIVVDIFRAAAGFHPGRVEPQLLLACFDFEWIRNLLGWDHERLTRWVWTSRRVWLENWRSFHVPAALIRAELERKDGARPLEALVGELSLLFARRPRTKRERRAQKRSWDAWRELDQVVVFSELDDLFEGARFESGRAQGAACLPFTSPELRVADLEGEQIPRALIPFEFADVVAEQRLLPARVDWRGERLPAWRAPDDFEQAASRLARLYAWRARAEAGGRAEAARPEYLDEEELLPWIAELWQAQFQARLAADLDVPLDGLGAPPAWPLPFVKWRRKAARQAADYAIRDRSSRPEILNDDPEESVVNLLLRFRADYGGFSILPRTKRLALAVDEDGVRVARNLIGEVRESTLEEVIEQREVRSSLSHIQRQRVRSEADSAAFNALVVQIYRNDEVHGTSGIEGLCDSALRGVNGFTEDIGLQEREDASGSPLFRPKIDGREVQLTLDMQLQKAAQYVIEHPVLPSGETMRDDVWFRNPVGAIVLATVDGEILAAASGPKQPHEPVEYRDGERRFSYDRCFRRRQFQPVGSIFKPFVAAYALDRLGLTPQTVLACEMRAGMNRAGWGKVSCNAKWGHGQVTLTDAIEHSCNAYFAQVGEMYASKQRFVEMARLFGFDRPSGVSEALDGHGFVEDWRIPRFHDSREFRPTDYQRGGNGLEVLEASPVQVARAAAGLATGRLPSMRLVRAIGGEPVPASYTQLPLDARSLQLVRSAMRGVVLRGSASGKGLESSLLGFDLAGKTGSADTSKMSDAYRAQLRVPQGRSPAMRKHTWFMGFFPAERPRAVVVIYLHDIGVTSGHSAVYVAGQFLKMPAVQAFARELER